ncbi:hypothetical protein BF503P1_00055 [Bacteroides phage BF503P1]|nr:hypothetical protein BF503P1_00055 [Bacteroides phage BF503P1]WAX07073.1 hypothetical protein BF503P4_00005 [Bacteroides phage BF503P4]
MIRADLIQTICILVFMIVNIIIASLIVINHIKNSRKNDEQHK